MCWYSSIIELKNARWNFEMVTQFKRGDFSTCFELRHGRPKTVTTPEIIDQIHELILEDRGISAKSIAEQLGISRERVGCIIHEDLDMWELSAKWVPKCLNADQKLQRCHSCEKHLEFFRPDPNDFLSDAIGDHGRNLVISVWPGEKTTINGVSACQVTSPPKNLECKNPLYKFSSRFFWDQDGIFFIDYLLKGQIIIGQCYLSSLVQLKDILWEKRRGDFKKVVLFFYDNAPANQAIVTQN